MRLKRTSPKPKFEKIVLQTRNLLRKILLTSFDPLFNPFPPVNVPRIPQATFPDFINIPSTLLKIKLYIRDLNSPKSASLDEILSF
jgi:hypothetical protein